MAETDKQQKPSRRLPDEPRPSRFPMIMFVITILVGIVVYLVNFVFLFEITEATGQNSDIVLLICYGLILLTFLAWLITVAFLNRWTMKTRMLGILGLIAIPAIFFVMGPVTDGNVGIARFEPLWSKRSKPVDLSNAGAVDLSKESAFDFPSFLGPNQNVESAPGIELDPQKFSSAKLLWRQTIGEGWSGFTARNGFAVTMEQREENECVTCYDIDSGKLKWIYEHKTRHQDAANMGKVGPRATPTIHNGFVFAMGANGNFVCLKGTDGSVVWSKDLNTILGITLADGTDRTGQTIQYESNTSLAWGRSGSPLIVDNKVIVGGGGPSGAATTLLAFDQTSGEIVWKGGDEMIAYGSPVLANVSALEQILLVGESKVMGFDPKSGEMLWSHPRPGSSGGMANCSQATVVSDNHILTSKGYPDGGGELIALEIEEDRLVPKTIWKEPRVLRTKFTNPVIFDGHSYSISNGFLECASMADGKRVWKDRKRLKNGQLLKVGKYILTHKERGTMMSPQSEIFLVEPDPSGYIEHGSLKTVKGVCWNTICIYENKLIVRSELEAACFELPALGSAF